MLVSKYTIRYNSWIYLTRTQNGKQGHLIIDQKGLVFQPTLSGSQSSLLQSQTLAIPSAFLCLMYSR